MDKLIYFLSFFFICSDAHAYIGPGAGFAVAGSFLVVFVAVLSALIILVTWPVRSLIRATRFRKVYARSSIKKAVIIGFDGMDYSLTCRMLDEGKLPNLAKLKEQGCFKPLRSTIPPISPVAWSSFQTGLNPGKHNIFDFLTRDRATYRPKLSSSEIRGAARTLSVGNFVIPFGKPDIRLLRKGVPFWKILGEHGIFSSVIRVPITFPPEKFYGVSLSGMCVPDLRGSQGIFSFYTTEADSDKGDTGGEVQRIVRNGNTVSAYLKGPEDPFKKGHPQLTCPFTISITENEAAELRVGGKKYILHRGVYSDWIPVSFRTSLGIKLTGICRFLLLSTSPAFRLYVTPVQIDPEKPIMPISHPNAFAIYLAKRQGRFATLGLAEDSWALNEKYIGEDDFLEQCRRHDAEREKMLFDALDSVERGLCVCVFDGTDRIQHTFWRHIDNGHPANGGKCPEHLKNAIEDAYREADRIVGKAVQECQNKDTLLMIISDHGFNTFRYGIDLNRWLEENGYLVLKANGRGLKNLQGVDWSKTRAFAIGLAGIYLNIRGREVQGIVDPVKDAPLLREEIAEKLRALNDPVRNAPAIRQVYNTQKLYAGPYKQDAPDLVIGYNIGYRASWQTAVGEVTDRVFHDNNKAWSGDHCIDQSLVPGVLFCNRKIGEEHPRLIDIAPTILALFGVDVPEHMDGRPWKIGA